MTLIAANDPNHIQLGLNVAQKENNFTPNLEIWLNGLVGFTPFNVNSFSNDWTRVTMTSNLTGEYVVLL